jgi:hypothetical protein
VRRRRASAVLHCGAARSGRRQFRGGAHRRTRCGDIVRDCGIESTGLLRGPATAAGVRFKLLLDARQPSVEWLSLVQTAHSSVRLIELPPSKREAARLGGLFLFDGLPVVELANVLAGFSRDGFANLVRAAPPQRASGS